VLDGVAIVNDGAAAKIEEVLAAVIVPSKASLLAADKGQAAGPMYGLFSRSH